ncbi:DnaB-like helicase C-terminal domain-containing protein, partial [Bacillus safensis]
RTGLYVLGAISSLGKTTFVQEVVDKVAEQGEHVLFFSLEMGRKELVAKSLVRTMGELKVEKKVNGEITYTRDLLSG